MAQNPPDWVSIFFGGIVALMFGTVTWIAKGMIDDKNVRITELEGQLNKKDDEIRNQLALFVEEIRNIETGKLGAAESLRLRKLLNLAEGLAGHIAGFDDCREAAKWLRTCQKDWVRRASEKAIDEYRDQIPRGKSKDFQGELDQYLNWVAASLDEGGRMNIPLSEYVVPSSIDIEYPYIAALSYIKDSESHGDLSSEAEGYLKLVLERLIEKIRKPTVSN
ncbi:MAG: hypothetical protein ACFB0G_08795 [Leptolyngbyaceae cyanobacterium]